MIKICIFDKLQTNAVQIPGNSLLLIPADNPYPCTLISTASVSERIFYKCEVP